MLKKVRKEVELTHRKAQCGGTCEQQIVSAKSRSLYPCERTCSMCWPIPGKGVSNGHRQLLKNVPVRVIPRPPNIWTASVAVSCAYFVEVIFSKPIGLFKIRMNELWRNRDKEPTRLGIWPGPCKTAGKSQS